MPSSMTVVAFLAKGRAVSLVVGIATSKALCVGVCGNGILMH